jgi:hypothetical protein
MTEVMAPSDETSRDDMRWILKASFVNGKLKTVLGRTISLLCTCHHSMAR